MKSNCKSCKDIVIAKAVSTAKTTGVKKAKAVAPFVAKKLVPKQFMLGTDPEFFFKQGRTIIGSEKVLKGTIEAPNTSKIIEDGVQVELNPRPSDCRVALANRIRECLTTLQRLTKANKCKIESKVTITISKKEYDSLSDKNKQFGCNESFNAYQEGGSIITVDPAKYRKRSAGGHIHLGVQGTSAGQKKALLDPKRTVPILDIVVANTLVMLDRDKGNIERRKHYGKAGEYRTPKHGLEYRTPSNFWLISQPMMSLAFGLARQAVDIVASGQDKHLLSLVEIKDVIKAVNTNDYELAKKNWDKYKHFLVKVAPYNTGHYPIDSDESVNLFEKLAKVGVDKFWGTDIIKNWTGQGDYTLFGKWGDFKHAIREHQEPKKKSVKTS